MRFGMVKTLISLALGAALALPVGAQEIPPFPPKPAGSVAERTMQESIYSPLPAVNRLPADAPNILIVLIDDVGPAQTDAYGGEIHKHHPEEQRHGRRGAQGLRLSHRGLGQVAQHAGRANDRRRPV